MAIRRAFGTLEPVVYYTNLKGEISLPPTSDTSTPRGWQREEAHTLAEIDALQRRLQQAEYDRVEKEVQHDEQAFAAAREKVRSNLLAKLVSSSTSEYEREFIRLYLQLRDDKRAQYAQRLREYHAYLEIREFDRPRDAQERMGVNPHVGDERVRQ